MHSVLVINPFMLGLKLQYLQVEVELLCIKTHIHTIAEEGCGLKYGIAFVFLGVEFMIGMIDTNKLHNAEHTHE